MNALGRPNLWDTLRRLFARMPASRGSQRPPRSGLAATLCVLGALLIWILLTMRDRHTAVIALPTEIVSLPAGQELVKPPPPTVDVEVEGEGFVLLQLFVNRPPVLIPAGSSNEVDLWRDAVPRLPTGVTRLGVSPRFLSLETGPRVQRRVPVASRATFDLVPSYDFSGPVRYTPDSVTVTGAAQVVDALTAWPTARRTFSDVQDTLRATLALSDTLQGYVTVSNAAVLMEAPVAAFTGAERTIDVRVRGVPSNEQLVNTNPSEVRVRFNVLLEQYREAMNAADFFATVSYEDIRRDNVGRLRPTLNLPDGLVIRDVEMIPPTVGYYNVLPGR